LFIFINIDSNTTRGSLKSRHSAVLSDISQQVNKAMEFQTWDLQNIKEQLEKEEEEDNEKLNIKYDDNYLAEHKTYCAFPAVSNFLACSMDYSEKNTAKLEHLDSLKEKLKTDLDINIVAGLDQRINHISSQHVNLQ
jgi:hypothetical protein